VTRPYPNLIHPVAVELRQLNRDKTHWDNRARESIGRANRDLPVVLQAQVIYKRIEDPAADFEGVRHDSLGYLMFRYRDLEEAGITIKRGDKISKIGNRSTDFFVKYFEDSAHYPEYGASFLVVWFVDRDPGESEE
jgi:hypothetical protein